MIFDNVKRAIDDLFSNRVTHKYFVKYIYMRIVSSFVASILRILYEHSLVFCRKLCTKCANGSLRFTFQDTTDLYLSHYFKDIQVETSDYRVITHVCLVEYCVVTWIYTNCISISMIKLAYKNLLQFSLSLQVSRKHVMCSAETFISFSSLAFSRF